MPQWFPTGEAPNAAHIPRVILSACDSVQDRKEAAAAGADRYLVRPVEIRTLIGLVENLIDRRRNRWWNIHAPRAARSGRGKPTPTRCHNRLRHNRGDRIRVMVIGATFVGVGALTIEVGTSGP